MKDSYKQRRILLLILLFSVIALIVLLIINKDNPDYWRFHHSFTGIGLAGLMIKPIIWFIESKTMRFDSIKEETFYYNDNFPDDAHRVLSVLYNTKTDKFVLAYFKNKQEIKPAVYTIHKNRISYLDLKAETTYCKKIYLDENDFENYIRVFRIKNKSTTTQILFFAYNVEPLNIRFDNQTVSGIDCCNTIGDFNVYGVIEDSAKPYTSANINGSDYPLTETTVYQCFINAKDILSNGENE